MQPAGEHAALLERRARAAAVRRRADGRVRGARVPGAEGRRRRPPCRRRCRGAAATRGYGSNRSTRTVHCFRRKCFLLCSMGWVGLVVSAKTFYKFYALFAIYYYSLRGNLFPVR